MAMAFCLLFFLGNGILDDGLVAILHVHTQRIALCIMRTRENEEPHDAQCGYMESAWWKDTCISRAAWLKGWL